MPPLVTSTCSGSSTGIPFFVRSLAAPEAGNRIAYERGKDAVRGFGIRVTAAGTKSFVLNYTIAGRERRLTIGGYPAWSVAAARDQGYLGASAAEVKK